MNENQARRILIDLQNAPPFQREAIDWALDEIGQQQKVINTLVEMLENDTLMFAWKDAVEEHGWHQEWTDLFDGIRSLQTKDTEPHAWVNQGICCRRHATTEQKMSTMIVCPFCGDKRCQRAEDCGCDCVEKSLQEKVSDD